MMSERLFRFDFAAMGCPCEALLFARTEGGETVVCSGMYPDDEGGWVPIPNGAHEVLPC